MSSDDVNGVRVLVRRMLKERGAATDPSDSESLFVGGRLDSMAAIDLIMRLETEFHVDFSKLDFDVALIDSISAIANLVAHG